jgi:hypothetical protein
LCLRRADGYRRTAHFHPGGSWTSLNWAAGSRTDTSRGGALVQALVSDGKNIECCRSGDGKRDASAMK